MLRVEDLTLGYGGEPILKGVSLTVDSGRFASLIGPSGSGKTSILRAVTGLQKPDSGGIALDVPQDAVVILFAPTQDALLADERERDCRVGRVDLTAEPVTVEHRLGDDARLDAVADA